MNEKAEGPSSNQVRPWRHPESTLQPHSGAAPVGNAFQLYLPDILLNM